MKTLLLTDIPPCSNLTAGIVTAQMCRLVPPQELAIFCVLNPHLEPALYPDLSEIAIKTVRKPNELNLNDRRIFPLDRLRAIAGETMKRFTQISPLVEQAVEFGRQQSVTSLWVILQGQTMARMANAVANGLNVPMRTQIWDPLGWWLHAHHVDRFNRKADFALFDQAMRQSKNCAAASWAMAREYERRYGTPCEVVIASFGEEFARAPVPELQSPTEIRIGMAGQFYAEEEWRDLLRALDYAGWQVAGRKVLLRVAGHKPPGGKAAPDGRIGYLGWIPQGELVDLLSRTCDILYCPYPFSPHMEEVARLSFPSKIPTYLAAGRPILFHGPDYSSPAIYLRERAAGLVCQGNEPAAVYNGLLQLVEDTALYQRLAAASRAAFLADFTMTRMEKSVRSFLGYPAQAAPH